MIGELMDFFIVDLISWKNLTRNFVKSAWIIALGKLCS